MKSCFFSRVMAISIILFLSFFSELSFAQSSKAYRNERYAYQLEYPSDYSVKIVGSATVFTSAHADKTFGFSPSVNVVAIDLKETPADLELFLKQSREALSKSLGNVKYLEDKKDKLAGLTAYKLVYTSKQKKANFKFLQYLIVAPKRAYVITYTALDSQYDKFIKQAQTIFKSIRIAAR